MADSDSDDSSTEGGGVGSILPIQQEDVRRIVSGQVISDMSSAVKELVDNALDAGATSINIRLFEQGKDVIEVSDDGTGVPKHSRPLLAMKHATSKIISFDDLYKDIFLNGQMQPNQLGFRGEALFSLAQISQSLIVCTRTQEEEIAEQMTFNRDGYLDPNNVQKVARKVGTTVAVVKLFDKLPVRRTDMIRRLKAQKAKLLRLIQAYAVLCVGVRINVYEKSGPGYSKTNVLMSTSEKSKSIKETISSVFGSSFLKGLTKFTVDLSPIVEKSLRSKISSDETKTNSLDDETLEATKNLWRIEGMVSNAPNSNERSVATEIQFFSINGRPVELPNVTKVIADVWRNFESAELGKKRAACIIGVYLPNSMFDVNVSPDKREVFFSCESEVCDLVREELFKLWSKQTQGTFLKNVVQRESRESSSISQSTSSGCKKEDDQPTKNDKPSNNPHPCETEGKRAFDYPPPVNDNVEIYKEDPNMSRRPLGRMRRRNAFIRNPENVGSYTTDAHAENSKIAAMTAAIDDCDNIDESNTKQPQQSSIEPNLKLQAKSTDDIPINGNCNDTTNSQSNQNGDSNRKKRKELNDVDIDEIEDSLQQKKIRQNDALEQKIWNQTKLNFMSAESSNQEDEISKLKSLQSTRTHRTKTAMDIDNNNTDMNAATKTNDHERSPPQDRPTLTNTIETNGSHQSLISSTSKDSNQHFMNISKSAKESSLPQQSSGTSRNATTKRLSSKVIEQKNESSPSSSNDAKKSKPEQDCIVWDAFENTENVVEKAKSMYISIMNRRQHLKKIQQTKTCLKDDPSNSNNGSTTTKNDNNNDNNDDDHLSSDKGKVVKLSKGDFMTMTVVGQFNLGFILALSDKGELWILDQHACDEQYNFERICKETKIHEQKLLKPLPLELSPSETNCILSNLSTFAQNGFQFHYDESKPPRHRLSLTSLPHSGSGGDGRKAVQFGKEDVGALCSLLGADGELTSMGSVAGSGTGADGSGSMGNNAVRRHVGVVSNTYNTVSNSNGSSGSNSTSNSTGRTNTGAIIRLPKSIAMFASRACRSSIMIGDALTETKMKEIIQRLHTVDQPWTCPHGRPTIRHIKDLLDDLIHDEKNSSRVVAGDFAALSQDDDEE